MDREVRGVPCRPAPRRVSRTFLVASFGGKVETSFAGSAIAFALALQRDGKIVAAGNEHLPGEKLSVGDNGQRFVLTRYRPRGTLDPSFGSAGKVTTAFSSCFVPKVRRKKLATAEARIRKFHCAVGKVTHAFSRKVANGLVMWQRPKAGTWHRKGAKVDLTVSQRNHG